MKKIVLLLCVMMLAWFSQAYASPVTGSNITVEDEVWLFDNGGWTGKQEDNETEPYCTTGQIWDMEAFFLDGHMLSIVAGFDLVNGQIGNLLGDLFIGYGDIKYGPLAEGTGYNGIITNQFGYNYAIDFDMTDKTYDVISLNEDSLLKAVSLSDNQEANPVEYVSGGQMLLSGINFGYWDNLSDSDTGLLGGDHNAITGIDLGFLGYDTKFFAKITQECGNDNLVGVGKIGVVPEPTTMILFGLGLLSLAGISRKKA